MKSVLEQLGFDPDDTRPLVRELAESMEARGVTRANVWWTEGSAATAEERARELLAIQWAIERGHTSRVECLDGAWGWQYSLDTGRRRFRVDWAMVPATFRDRLRSLRCRYRIWRDRHVPNPYRPLKASQHLSDTQEATKREAQTRPNSKTPNQGSER